MAKSHVELDFLGLRNAPSSVAQPQTQTQPHPRLDRRESFRGISKINPEIVKSVFASASKHENNNSNNNAASKLLSATPPMSPRVGVAELPIFQQVPSSGPSIKEKATETAPLTIFYKGTVSVYDMSMDEAEQIMKLALERNISINNGQVVDHSSLNPGTTTDDMLKPLNDGDGDMPLKRKMSLQRFFEKRKERLMTVAPYSLMDNNHVASIQKMKI